MKNIKRKKTLIKYRTGRMIILGLIISILLSVSGCHSQGDNSSPDYEIAERLNQKYGKQFVIMNISEQSADMAFQESYYLAQVYSSENGEYFETVLYKKSKTLKDDYARLVYGKQIEDIVTGVLKDSRYVQEYTYSPLYYKSENSWYKQEDFQEYLKSGDICIEGNATINVASDEESAKIIYEIVQKFAQNNLIYSFKFISKSKTIRVSNLFEEPSYQSILGQYIGVKQNG